MHVLDRFGTGLRQAWNMFETGLIQVHVWDRFDTGACLGQV
jgi:hypothetical protein